MCTYISSSAAVQGAGKGATGWFPVTQAMVGFDHAAHTPNEHALLIDFVNYDMGTGARVALELDMQSGKTLIKQLSEAIAAAEAAGVQE